MPRLHFLNVRNGDCIIIEHVADRLTMMDICAGNMTLGVEARLARILEASEIRANYRMCQHPTNPIEYISLLNKSSVFRFILSHPDCDHLDGFDRLCTLKTVVNFWDSGIRRPKPDFAGSPYLEEDWNRYESVRDGKTNVRTITARAGNRFKFANIADDGASGGDGLYILAPDDALVEDANETECWNDGSLVVLYRSPGGRIILPGDAHDNTWNYVIKNHATDVSYPSVLIAPHHGRHSDGNFAYLNTVRPQLTLFGCAPSEHLAYNEWNRRDLPIITNNQAGNIVLDIDAKRIDVYVENERFAAKVGNPSLKNNLGYFYVTSVGALGSDGKPE